jgi:hypothetical protein
LMAVISSRTFSQNPPVSNKAAQDDQLTNSRR